VNIRGMDFRLVRLDEVRRCLPGVRWFRHVVWRARIIVRLVSQLGAKSEVMSPHVRLDFF
jgi:hypothetical protein